MSAKKELRELLHECDQVSRQLPYAAPPVVNYVVLLHHSKTFTTVFFNQAAGCLAIFSGL